MQSDEESSGEPLTGLEHKTTAASAGSEWRRKRRKPDEDAGPAQSRVDGDRGVQKKRQKKARQGGRQAFISLQGGRQAFISLQQKALHSRVPVDLTDDSAGDDAFGEVAFEVVDASADEARAERERQHDAQCDLQQRHLGKAATLSENADGSCAARPFVVAAAAASSNAAQRRESARAFANARMDEALRKAGDANMDALWAADEAEARQKIALFPDVLDLPARRWRPEPVDASAMASQPEPADASAMALQPESLPWTAPHRGPAATPAPRETVAAPRETSQSVAAADRRARSGRPPPTPVTFKWSADHITLSEARALAYNSSFA